MKLKLKNTILLGSAFLLAACGATSADSGTDTTTESDSNVQESSETASSSNPTAEEHIVRIAMASEIDSIDPHQSSATDTGAILANIHDGLIDTNTEGAVIPALAESWEISDDNLTYTFHLVQDAVFHNGDPVTADDVVASYAPLAGLTGAEPLSSKWEIVADIQALDEFTVEITLSSIDSGFLARTMSAIMPAGYEDQETNPIGAGPFEFDEWLSGQHLTMVAFEDYYNEESIPEIDGVEWVLMQDNATINLALQTGEIDIAGTDLAGKQQLGDAVNYLEGPMNMPVIFGLNHTHEPFQDERVRQAINHAIDKQEIIDIVFQGNAVELGSNFSPVMAFYYQEGLQEIWAYDVERAQELLADAGYPDLTFTIKVPSHAQFYVDTAQVMQSQLAKAGITMNIAPVDWNTWLEEVYTDFNHEATIVGLTGKIDPYDVLIRFREGYGRNFINFNNPDYNAAIDQAIGELDEDARADYYKEAQTILTEDAASVFLMDPNRILAVSKKYDGLELYPIVKYNLEDLKIVQ